MTDKEKIKAEIEKAYNEAQNRIKLVKDEYYEGKVDAYRNALVMFDSLEEEPVSEEIEVSYEAKINEAHRLGRKEGMFLAKTIFKEPVSKDLNEAANDYSIYDAKIEAFKDGARWQKANLWKDAQGDDLPEIDREVIALTQPYSDNDEHLRVVFAHRPNKYAKVWNSDFGEEQVVEIERYDKGGWNIPDVKFWLDVEFPFKVE